MYRKFKIVTIALFFQVLAFAQSDLDEVHFTILSADSGDELYSTFGHTALRIYNDDRTIDQVYNWGTFNFDTPNFYVKFMRGQLPYRLGIDEYDEFLMTYHYQQRSVWEQELMLNDEQKQELIALIQENLKPENRYYDYDFFFDNCTTRVFDLTDELVGPITFTTPPTDITFREMLKENLKNMPWTDFGIDLLIGARADRKTTEREQLFLPMYLHDRLNDARTAAGADVISTDFIVLDFTDVGELRRQDRTNWPFYTFVLFFLMLVAAYFFVPGVYRILSKIFIGLIAIISLFMAFMWFGTEHVATKANWNLLWASPLYLGWYWLKNNRIYHYVLITVLAAASINTLIQFLPQFYHLAFLPIVLTLIFISAIRLKSVAEPQ